MKAVATATDRFISSDDPSFSFKKGDQVLITDKDDKGWYFGSLNGKKGWFPAIYVAINQKESTHNNCENGTLPFSASLKDLLGSSVRYYSSQIYSFLQIGNYHFPKEVMYPI